MAKTSGGAPATKDILITRVFDATLERVWKAWTEPEQIKRWWGPKDFTSPAAKIDLRTGGKYLYCMHGPAGSQFDQDMWSGGTFTEVIPMKKIIATDHFADKDGNHVKPESMGMPGVWPDEMTVTVTFEEAGPGKTKLTVKHEGHPIEMADMAQAGWNQSLDKFTEALR